MRNKYISIFMTLSLTITMLEVKAQGLSIGSGTILSLGSATLSLSNNWNNSGTFTPGSGTVNYNGAGENQTITNSSDEVFNNVIINKTTGDVQLINNITVLGTLTLANGDIDMNGHILTMGSSSVLTESAGNTVKGSGCLTTTRIINAPSSINLLGIEITSAENLGSTVVNRGHSVQSSGINNSISRYYDILPANNTGLDASLKLYYDDSEVNDLTESDLIPFRSEDSGTNWTPLNGSSINTASNMFTCFPQSLYCIRFYIYEFK